MTDPVATLKAQLADALRQGDRRRANRIKAELDRTTRVETVVTTPDERT